MHRIFIAQDTTENDSIMGWRLCWDHGGFEWATDMRFARRKDASLALKAVVDSGATFEDFAGMPKDEKTWKFNRIMLEAMQW